MWNVITLDGYFEGDHNWDLSFHNDIWCRELEQMSLKQLRAADFLLFGRVTYEGMAAYWTSAGAETAEAEVAKLMNIIPKIVASKTLNSADWSNTTIISENVSDEIRKHKEADGKDIYVFGSSILSESLISDNLFDEFRIGIAPVILGKGRLLFPQGNGSKKLALVSTQQLTSGGVILTYARVND